MGEEHRSAEEAPASTVLDMRGVPLTRIAVADVLKRLQSTRGAVPVAAFGSSI